MDPLALRVARRFKAATPSEAKVKRLLAKWPGPKVGELDDALGEGSDLRGVWHSIHNIGNFLEDAKTEDPSTPATRMLLGMKLKTSQVC